MQGTAARRPESSTVLYVEDSPDDWHLFQHACLTAGVCFVTKLAPGGEEGIAYLAGQGEFRDRTAHPLPDFILLDIKMPNVDGFDVLKWIRSQPKVSGIPVALYSSSSVDRDVLRGYLTGTTFYIPKQQGLAALRELVEAVDQCLGSDGSDCDRLMRLSIPAASI